jgi:hypothetical protein
LLDMTVTCNITYQYYTRATLLERQSVTCDITYQYYTRATLLKEVSSFAFKMPSP